VHKSDADILGRARAAKPDARIAGVTVFPMIVRPKARELIVGVADDPTFGPVIAFGQGGTAVEVISDKSLALPPLNLDLAERLIARTRVSRILKAYRNVPAADERAIELLLVKLSQLVADFPEIREIDLNPVLADETGVIAVDARISVAPVEAAHRGASGNPRFAIRPYPTEWVRHMQLRDGTAILVRPVRPEDEPLYGPFFAAVTPAPDRLCAGHGVRYDRRHQWCAVGRRAAARGRQLRERRIRHPHSLRPEGSRSRLAVDAVNGRICPQRRHSHHQGSGAAREYDDAGDVSGTRLPYRVRPEEPSSMVVTLELSA
jgi:hypothetical protein